MPRKKKPKADTVFMTDTQIEEVKKEIDSIENLIARSKNPQDHVGSKIQDTAELMKETAKKKKLLEDHVPRRLRGANADRKYAEAKELAKEIQDAMPRSRAYYNRYPKSEDGHSKHADFEKAVQQQVEFQSPAMQKKILRYKSIMRRLDPSDPTVTNIEALRE